MNASSQKDCFWEFWVEGSSGESARWVGVLSGRERPANEFAGYANEVRLRGLPYS